MDASIQTLKRKRKRLEHKYKQTRQKFIESTNGRDKLYLKSEMRNYRKKIFEVDKTISRIHLYDKEKVK